MPHWWYAHGDGTTGTTDGDFPPKVPFPRGRGGEGFVKTFEEKGDGSDGIVRRQNSREYTHLNNKIDKDVKEWLISTKELAEVLLGGNGDGAGSGGGEGSRGQQ